MTLRVRIIFLLAICGVMLCMNGCSGGDGDAEATEQAVVSVDPTRASAKALFERVRTICDEEYPDAEAYYALVRTETPKQSAWLAFIHNVELPKYRFGKACFDKFGELPLVQGRSVWEIAKFTWEKEDADRAVIECVNENGVKSPLHLVRIDGKWWISGYTFEYAKHIGFEHPGFEKMTSMLPGLGPYVDRVTARVRSGEFSTLEEAETAREAAVEQYSADHPQPNP